MKQETYDIIYNLFDKGLYENDSLDEIRNLSKENIIEVVEDLAFLSKHITSFFKILVIVNSLKEPTSEITHLWAFMEMSKDNPVFMPATAEYLVRYIKETIPKIEDKKSVEGLKGMVKSLETLIEKAESDMNGSEEE